MHLHDPGTNVVRDFGGPLRVELPVEIALGDDRCALLQHLIGGDKQQTDRAHSDSPGPVFISKAQCLIKDVFKYILFEKGNPQVLGYLSAESCLACCRGARSRSTTTVTHGSFSPPGLCLASCCRRLCSNKLCCVRPLSDASFPSHNSRDYRDFSSWTTIRARLSLSSTD